MPKKQEKQTTGQKAVQKFLDNLKKDIVKVKEVLEKAKEEKK
jgi:hypothetical protein